MTWLRDNNTHYNGDKMSATVWLAEVGINRYEITEEDLDNDDFIFGGKWNYCGDGEHYQVFKTEPEAKAGIVELMKTRLEFANKTITELSEVKVELSKGAIHPGAVFYELAYVDDGDKDVAELSRKMDVDPVLLIRFMDGLTPITPALTKAISKFTNTSPVYWHNMQGRYDDWVAENEGK